MEPFATAGRRAQLARCRSLARRALAEHGLLPAQLRVMGHGENTTFRAATPRGDVLVRVHRAGYHSRDEIDAEIAFLDALLGATPVVTPRPLRTPGGDAVLRLDGPGLDAPRDVVVLDWIDGRLVGMKGAGAATYEKLGAATAHLHAFAMGWTPPNGFTRPRHAGGEQVYGDDAMPSLEAVDLLSPAQRERFLDAEARSGAAIRAHEADEPPDVLLHADLHVFNVVHHGGSLAVIDFDDLLFGHPVVDFAVPLGSTNRHHHEAYFRGYRSVRPLPDHWIRILPAYVVSRRLTMVRWMYDRMQDIDDMHRYVPQVLAHAELGIDWFDGDRAAMDRIDSLPRPDA